MMRIIRRLTVRWWPKTESPSDSGVAKDDAYVASQWQLMWWRFRRHKVAMIGFVFIVVLYGTAPFPEFFAPYDPTQTHVTHQYAPPNWPRFIDSEGRFHLRPFVYAMEQTIDRSEMRRSWENKTDEILPIRLFVRGSEYRILGRIRGNLRLFGVRDGLWFPLGTDNLGRDMLSRMIFGARISISIGLLGVIISLVVGVTLGGISGYFGGRIDHVIQRLMELLRAIPGLPLWMALSAAMPPWWPQPARYFAIVAILSLLGWTGIARQTRGKFLAIREEDYVLAAEFLGARKARIIFRHMLPSFASHVIATASLAIPAMILGETALSFLGIGLTAPTISWGVLLQQAQNIQSVALYPWMLFPGLAVTITVLLFNFFGDGVRDAADPYS